MHMDKFNSFDQKCGAQKTKQFERKKTVVSKTEEKRKTERIACRICA